MPEVLISRFISPSDDVEEIVRANAGKKMQLGFFYPSSFFSLDHARIKQLCDDNGIQVMTIHGPPVDIFDGERFFAMLNIVREKYRVDSVTLHPSSGSTIKGLTLLRRNKERIYDAGVYLLYENFDSSKRRKKWLAEAKTIYMLPFDFCYLTYDTSHVKIGTNIAADLKQFSPKLGMVHLSNKTASKNHVPIHEGKHNLDETLEFLRGYPGFVALEYGPDYHRQLHDDYDYLNSYFRSGKSR